MSRGGQLVNDMPKSKRRDHAFIVDPLHFNLDVATNLAATQTTGFKASAVAEDLQPSGLMFKTTVYESNQQLKCSTGSFNSFACEVNGEGQAWMTSGGAPSFVNRDWLTCARKFSC